MKTEEGTVLSEAFESKILATSMCQCRADVWVVIKLSMASYLEIKSAWWEQRSVRQSEHIYKDSRRRNYKELW